MLYRCFPGNTGVSNEVSQYRYRDGAGILGAWVRRGGGSAMFAAVARLTGLLGGDIDREYCMKLHDTYSKSSEPELLAGYTKVRTDPTVPASRGVRARRGSASAAGSASPAASPAGRGPLLTRGLRHGSTGATTTLRAARASTGRRALPRTTRRSSEDARASASFAGASPAVRRAGTAASPVSGCAAAAQHVHA